VAKQFHRYWASASGKNAIKVRWDLTWENWVDSQIDKYGLKPAGTAQPYHSSEDEWVAKQMRSPKGMERAKSMGREACEKMLREVYRQTTGGLRT
jgi:hypothetical protein